MAGLNSLIFFMILNLNAFIAQQEFSNSSLDRLQ